MPTNVVNGKAFEYAIAYEYYRYLVEERGVDVAFVDDAHFRNAKASLEQFSGTEREAYCLAARASIKTMMKLEPGFFSPKNHKDILSIRIAGDGEGEDGDVRDVIFSRPVSQWELGFSAKNNNDAVKHSRLSMSIDFGDKWLNHPVDKSYWDAIRPVFDDLSELKCREAKWRDIESEKPERVYKPILNAFRAEILRLAKLYKDVPENLVLYLLGEYPFYKLIKDDSANMVIVKSFNLNGALNKTVNGVHPAYKTAKVNLPTRIVEFEYKLKQNGEKSENTLDMILDNGWEISFRLHSASTYVENSLKFDVQLLGNPPILFTQYIFSED